MVKYNIGYDIDLNNGLVANVYTHTGGSLSITPDGDGAHYYYIAVDTSSSTSTINLPTTSNNGCEVGRTYCIIDYKGNSATNNITIDAGSGNTINGNQTVTVALNNASLHIICTQTSGSIIWNFV